MAENTPFVLPVPIQNCGGFHLKSVASFQQSLCDSDVLSSRRATSPGCSLGGECQ